MLYTAGCSQFMPIWFSRLARFLLCAVGVMNERKREEPREGG